MKKVLLTILDGYGISDNLYGNATKLANTKNLTNLLKNSTTLEASGSFVGLPEGQMGNSEVGHTNIGAGRIVYQDLTLINNLIETKEFFHNETLIKTILYAKNKQKKLHLLGLLSTGGVHSHLNHLFAILDLCHLLDFKNVYVHAILDGRDTRVNQGKEYLEILSNKLQELNFPKIATVIGRFYAMDRDKRYERVEKAYLLFTKGIGQETKDLLALIEKNYYNNITDEFMEPILNNSSGLIQEKDALIFYNFRPDRAREITRAFVDYNFQEFKRDYLNLYYTTMTNYDETIKNVKVIIPDLKITNTLGEIVSNNGLKQLRIAETEKYAHVTFFLNGGIETKFLNEDRVLIPSPKDVKTYDLKPEMSAELVVEKVILALKENKYDLIVLNFANPDMVGHTGNLKAVIKALEYLDIALGKIYEAVLENDYAMVITADHGNAECMLNKDGTINTNHTTNKVPLTILNYPVKGLKTGKLADIAPTILTILEIFKPKEMTGESLIEK